MDQFNSFRLRAISAALIIMSVNLVNGQISTPCTTSMISSLTPCINFITGSSGNGSAVPTSGCCDSLKSLVSSSTDCSCLLITGSVPFQLPINRTLAISLPRACNMGSVPIQCKASGSPLSAPGPAIFNPTSPSLSPTAAPASPLSPRASKAVATAPVAVPKTEIPLDLTPASPPAESEAPTRSTTGIRPVLTPSASASSYNIIALSPLIVVFTGFIVLKSY
ncbi:Non-specific lipid-transfer protein-like protein [Quillaja saponaria]|uniref:Non-specific lipid-transfer protein-like protein n=1 Tax=Quillaja saponaria TaxID=32244 RepID=A0AAD7Q0U0_QUISA|nr:Non-specific lipid-transfer protein-like protein [Quillaja saponaria]